MPYFPDKRGPFAVAVSALVAAIAPVLGVVLLAGHHPARGAALLIGGVGAAVVAVPSRCRQ